MLNVSAVNNAIGKKRINDTTLKRVKILYKNKNIKSIKQIVKQNTNFSTRLPNANKKIRESSFSLLNIKFKAIEKRIEKLQKVKVKKKVKFHQDVSNYLVK